MFNHIKNLSLVLIVALFVVSCSEDESFADNEDVIVSNFGTQSQCLDIVFPITYELVDGTQVSGESKEEIREAIQLWKETNPDTRPEAELLFPIEVVNAEGETITVEDLETLKAMKKECQGGKTKCFELVYPVSVALVDGSVITAESKETLKEAIQLWKESNPDTRPEAEFVFPLEVINSDGETVVLEDAEALQDLKSTCGGRRGSRR